MCTNGYYNDAGACIFCNGRDIANVHCQACNYDNCLMCSSGWTNNKPYPLYFYSWPRTLSTCVSCSSLASLSPPVTNCNGTSECYLDSSLNYHCVNCQANSVFNKYTNKCDCITGFYQASIGNCSLCTSPCLTCQNSDINCLSCIANYSLRGNQCIERCLPPCSGCSGGSGYFVDSFNQCQ